MSEIGKQTSMFSIPKNAENVEFYKNKYIEELENRVEVNEKLAQKDKLISKLLSRIKELEGDNFVPPAEMELVQSQSEESEDISLPVKAPNSARRNSTVKEQHSLKKASISSPASMLSEVPPASAKKVDSPVKNIATPQKMTSSAKASPSSAKIVQGENEIAYADLEGDPLVAWNEVIKVSHPGSLGQMTALAKQRLEVAFTEFLAENIPQEKVQRCKVLNNKNNVVVALPESLIDSFGEWLDEKIEEGMLDKVPLAKWKEEQAIITGKTVSPKRRESGKVQLDKHVIKKKSAKESQVSFPGWVPWVDIVHKKFPDLNMNLPQFILFVKAFVLSNSLEERKLNISGVEAKVLAIPEEMTSVFLDSFTEKFKYMKTVQAIIDMEPRGEKRDSVEMGDSYNQPRKMAKADAKQTVIKDSGLDLYNKVLETVMPTYADTPRDFRLQFKNLAKEWLINKMGGLESFKENCALRYVHGNQARSTFGIPPELMDSFKDWASAELKKTFGSAASF